MFGKKFKSKCLAILLGLIVAIIFLGVLDGTCFFIYKIRGPINKDFFAFKKIGNIPVYPYEHGVWVSKPLLSTRFSPKGSDHDFCSNQKIIQQHALWPEPAHSKKYYYLEFPSDKKKLFAKLSVGEKVIYDTTFSLDKYGRRLSLEKKTQDKKKYLLLFGGSIVFGQGLNDEDHLGSLLNEELSEHHVYNYGVPGTGLAQSLAITLNRDLKKEVLGQEGTAIYLYIDFDVLRLVPTFVEGHRSYMKKQVFLKEDKKDHFIPVAPSTFPYSELMGFYRFWQRTHFQDLFNSDFPSITEAHLKKFTQALVQMRQELYEKHGVTKFYVVNFPGQSNLYFSFLRSFLEKNQIQYFDYSNWNPEEYLEEPTYLCDAHPRPELMKLFAHSLASLIEIKKKKE